MARLLALWTAALCVAIQVIRPARTNPPIDPQKTLVAIEHPPASVIVTLDRACGDCHTNQTRWPWYTNIAPVSWWIVHHVNEGRRRVSFSEWATYDTTRRLKALDDICQRIDRANMPLTSYLLIHHDAELTADDRQMICEWTQRAAIAVRH